MKLRCEVIKIENCGDTLRIELQGKAGIGRYWPIVKQTIQVADTTVTRKTYHMGRIVELSVGPQ